MGKDGRHDTPESVGWFINFWAGSFVRSHVRNLSCAAGLYIFGVCCGK
jgi:hypothetical protein